MIKSATPRRLNTTNHQAHSPFPTPPPRTTPTRATPTYANGIGLPILAPPANGYRTSNNYSNSESYLYQNPAQQAQHFQSHQQPEVQHQQQTLQPPFLTSQQQQTYFTTKQVRSSVIDTVCPTR
jgi:hypothetical protein